MKAAQDIHIRKYVYSLQYVSIIAKEIWNARFYSQLKIHIKIQKNFSEDNNKDKHKFHWVKLIIDLSKQPVVVR